MDTSRVSFPHRPHFDVDGGTAPTGTEPAGAGEEVTSASEPRARRHDTFARNLGTPRVTEGELRAAADAVKQEYRANNRLVRLQCLKVEQVGHAHDMIFSLEVARFGEMDWTWEGARAFLRADADGGYSWSGDVLEVDAVASKLFVRADPDVGRPTVGAFMVEPFAFLRALNALYNSEHAADAQEGVTTGLAIATGRIQGEMCASAASLPELREVWSSSLGYVWGPPGTGKTTTIGRQIAEAIKDPDERILVVSTTNKATDEVAISIGKALKATKVVPTESVVSRVGAGANITKFRSEGVERLLIGGAALMRERLAALESEYRGSHDPVHRAALQARIKDARAALAASREAIQRIDSQVVVCTAFTAVNDLATPDAARDAKQNRSSFTTVVIDEAGLLSRAAVAALSLHAAKRVVLVGDHKQLSPISKISRILDPTKAKWIASSALEEVSAATPATYQLRTQYRMHPDVRRAVSEYQYGGVLEDGSIVRMRHSPLPPDLHHLSRAIWYVLDEDAGDLAHIRADRGEGNKSWVRRHSLAVMDRLFRAHPDLRSLQGLFISPFAAQARVAQRWLREAGASQWEASTVHRQQGAEADIVVVDTVNASSAAWSHAEWKRLMNVAMSRARHMLIFLASRAEMREPYLVPLQSLLAPRVITGIAGRFRWMDVRTTDIGHVASAELRELAPERLGAQLEARKALRPILSAEQQRLCAYPIDGKPRLVRGVAGSGKTAVLAHWLVRRMRDDPSAQRIWVVYANRALRGLLSQAIEIAWADLAAGCDVPWDRIQLFHVLELLEQMERQHGIHSPYGNASYDYAARASVLLNLPVEPTCDALFIDEAQDFGEPTLAYLTKLVKPTSGAGRDERSVNIFYDNAQNLYRRGTPTWSTLGLDMRGRSTVMKESFRSTQPITEFALNVLYRLQPPDDDSDHRELLSRELLDSEQRNGRKWWRVRFNQVDGPAPDCRRYPERSDEIDALIKRITRWVAEEGVRPADIRIIALDSSVRRQVVQRGEIPLRQIGVEILEQKRQDFTTTDTAVIVTTPHSFKGHESEIIAVVGADKFVVGRDTERSDDRVQPSALYVAMTRARSLLYVSSITRSAGSPAARIVDTLQQAIEDLGSPPEIAEACSPVEERLELLSRIGEKYRDWFVSLQSSYPLVSGPIMGSDGTIVAEPLFSVTTPAGQYAYFEQPPSTFVANQLEDLRVAVMQPGVKI